MWGMMLELSTRFFGNFKKSGFTIVMRRKTVEFDIHSFRAAVSQTVVTSSSSLSRRTMVLMRIKGAKGTFG